MIAMEMTMGIFIYITASPRAMTSTLITSLAARMVDIV